MSDHTEIKNRLAEYLSLKGIEYNKKSKTYRCMFHSDENPSATLYQNPGGHVLTCHVCSKSYDIFNICGQLENLSSFPEQLKSVKATLGIYDNESRRLSGGHVTLSLESARQIYTRENIEKISSRTEWGEIKSTWKYLDRSGNVQALDVRFENNGKKSVITFWYDGKKLQTKNYPILIYGLDRLTDKPVLIHEGAKCADIGQENLTEFDNISWNGGSGKAQLCNWSPLKKREVFILRDNDEPGLKAAEAIKKQLPHAKIVNPPTSGKGDDIEQFLQIMSPEELTEYILKVSDITASPSDTPPVIPDAGFSEPFKILGMCEGEGHFIDNWGYYQHYKLDSIGKGRLMNIAPLEYWKAVFPAGRDGVKWDDAISDIITSCKIKEFDTKKLKGRGAWRTGDKICYNDGCKLWGEPDENNIYMKLERREVGLDREPLEPEKVARIRDILFDLSFETKTDAVRTMGWSAIAPFSGALTYRPTLLLTGESGHGKTKVQTMFIKPLTKCNHYDMGTTSSAGVRRQIGKDSAVGFFDESGKDTGNKQINISEILAFIRSNYSDDSPDSVKANINSDGYVSYKMSSMFGLATTDPSVENVQDENRILRVNFVKPKHSNEEWNAIEKELGELLSEENCHRIRALTWSRLHIIMDLAKKITQLARNRTNRDIRSSHADMLLASAYMVVWCNTPEPTEEQINDMLDKYYQYQPMEENRSESEEYVDRIMQEIIEVIHENAREKITIQECCQRIYDRNYKNEDGQLEEISPKKAGEYARHIAMYGIKVIPGGGIHIANNNHMIQKITGLGAGYGKLFARHRGYQKYDKPVTYFGKSHRGIMIMGLIEKQEKDKTEVEKLMEVI
jgi:putative DNA primase/helicase